jgi:hypothetical protein
LKKTIAILLLIIHCFNLAGYPVFFAILQHSASEKVISQLDNGEYNDSELVEVKVAYSLPYSTNWKEYERYNGELEINGVHYNYVKRKLYNDTLYLMCIPNREKTNLGYAKNDYFNSINGVTNHGPEKKSHAPVNSIQKSFGQEYNLDGNDYCLSLQESNIDLKFPSLNCALPYWYANSCFQPPKA